MGDWRVAIIGGTIATVAGGLILFALTPSHQQAPSLPPYAGTNRPPETPMGMPLELGVNYKALAEHIPRVIIKNNGMGEYSINNGHPSDGGFTDVNVSLWAVAGRRLQLLDSRHFDYVNSGPPRVVENIKFPFRKGRIAFCISFTSAEHRIEMIDFLSNEEFTATQLMLLPLSRFRAAVIEVDGSGALCSKMPHSAVALL